MTFIESNLEILKASLNEVGISIRAMVYKKKPDKTILVFWDKEQYISSERNDFTVDFEDLSNFNSQN